MKTAKENYHKGVLRRVMDGVSAPFLMTISVKELGKRTKLTTLVDTNQNESFNCIKAIIDAQTTFDDYQVKIIEIRETHNSKDSKTISVSFNGGKSNKVFLFINININ